MERPPDDWPTPMDAITPERLAEIEAEVTELEHQVDELKRRSAAMVEGMRQHYAGFGRDPTVSSSASGSSCERRAT